MVYITPLTLCEGLLAHPSNSPEPSSRGTLHRKPLVRSLPPSQALLYLHSPEDEGAQGDGDGEVYYGQRLGLQEALEERGVDRQELQHERECDRPEERLVREQTYSEKRFVAGADGHDVAHLGEGEGGEDHGLQEFGCSLLVPETNAQRYQRHEHPDPDDVTTEPAGEDVLAGGVRR